LYFVTGRVGKDFKRASHVEYLDWRWSGDDDPSHTGSLRAMNASSSSRHDDPFWIQRLQPLTYDKALNFADDSVARSIRPFGINLEIVGRSLLQAIDPDTEKRGPDSA